MKLKPNSASLELFFREKKINKINFSFPKLNVYFPWKKMLRKIANILLFYRIDWNVFVVFYWRKQWIEPKLVMGMCGTYCASTLVTVKSYTEIESNNFYAVQRNLVSVHEKCVYVYTHYRLHYIVRKKRARRHTNIPRQKKKKNCSVGTYAIGHRQRCNSTSNNSSSSSYGNGNNNSLKRSRAL